LRLTNSYEPLTTTTGFHCWLAAPSGLSCTTPAPLVLDEPLMSIIFPLLTLVIVKYPSPAEVSRHRWLLPPVPAHCSTRAPS
jgi:hypothetical protein